MARENRPIAVRIEGAVELQLLPFGQIPELLFTAGFEREELARVFRFLRPGMRVLDIGANVGLYTVLAAKRVGPGGGVWAFEPSSESRDRLVKNLALNRVDARVLPLALGAAGQARAALRREPGFRDGDRYLSSKPVADDDAEVEMVPVVTLDDFVAADPLLRERIDFLKMDIEGGEFAVFHGASAVLSDNPRLVMMFECKPAACARLGYDALDLLAFIESFGFQAYVLERGQWVRVRERGFLEENLWAARDVAALPG
jgi:FkbM family methyltransferase